MDFDEMVKQMAYLQNLAEKNIDSSDTPLMTGYRKSKDFFKPVKKSISIRIDEDVVAFFKWHAEKYQPKINEILRNYMVATLKDLVMKRATPPKARPRNLKKTA